MAKAKQPPGSPTPPILFIGFFQRAKEFRDAYSNLPVGPPPEWPKYVLFYHAIELALKAYLLRQGISEQCLKDDFGHNLKKLVDEAVNRGLSLPHGCQERIADLTEQPPMVSVSGTPTHLLIRYPPHGPVWSLGQFKPDMQHVFTAVASGVGLPQ
jgi:hypothetical protein